MSESPPDLKALSPEKRLVAIRYGGDAYWVTTQAGETRTIWERNLRLKPDSSVSGPAKGVPALLGAEMMGDRFSIIFSDPSKRSALLSNRSANLR